MQLLYPPPRGELELRAALTAYLGRVRGVRATAGPGGDLRRLLAGADAAVPGAAAGAASPASRSRTRASGCHRRIIEAAGLESVPVPVDDEGIQTSLLAGLDVSAVLLSPAHSYPSGVALSADRRVELLEWARTSGALVIEDDYDAELRYDRLPVGALQGLDPDRVVYGGSVSKVLSPALRLGWLVAPPQLAGDIIRVRLLEDFAAEAFGQLTLARFIDSGGFARHLRRVRPDLPLTPRPPAGRPRDGTCRRSGRAATRPACTCCCGCPTGSTPSRSRRWRPSTASSSRTRPGTGPTPAPRPPTLLLGYGAQREHALAHGIEALAAEPW